jgi:hypothetical protein
MIKELNDYDWKEAFKCACYGGASHVLFLEDSLRDIKIEDVDEIFFMEPGMNDDKNWELCGKAGDIYFFISAGCDYTGWDCRSWGDAVWSHSFLELVELGLTKELRRNWADVLFNRLFPEMQSAPREIKGDYAEERGHCDIAAGFR